MSVSKKICIEITVGGQNFKCLEVNDRGDNRDIQMIHCVAKAQWVEYRSNKGPIPQDEKWYHRYPEVFYQQLGTAIAEEYINNQNVWPNSVTTTINTVSYTYTKF